MSGFLGVVRQHNAVLRGTSARGTDGVKGGEVNTVTGRWSDWNFHRLRAAAIIDDGPAFSSVAHPAAAPTAPSDKSQSFEPTEQECATFVSLGAVGSDGFPDSKRQSFLRSPSGEESDRVLIIANSSSDQFEDAFNERKFENASLPAAPWSKGG